MHCILYENPYQGTIRFCLLKTVVELSRFVFSAQSTFIYMDSAYLKGIYKQRFMTVLSSGYYVANFLKKMQIIRAFYVTD